MVYHHVEIKKRKLHRCHGQGDSAGDDPKGP